MEIKQKKLDELKGTNPFKLPEGYMEGLAEQIMSRLPEKPREEVKMISLYERVRPWLYLAAVFVGLIFLFKALIHPQPSGEETFQDESLYVQATLPDVTLFVHTEEDQEYLEYLENEFYNNAFTEVIENIE
jgi:hypothetical protein